MIHFDERWIGRHGIGRFAAELAQRIPHRAIQARGRPMSALDPIALALALAHDACGSVFFSPGYNAPLWGRMPFVFTVHDLNHIDRPENSSAAKRLYYATILKRACRRAARVLTVSDFSRRRIVSWSGMAAHQVVNVGNGVGPEFHTSVAAHRPGYPYVLCVSNRRLHKNEFRVVDAFGRSGIESAARLVFTGRQTPELQRRVAAAGLNGRVEFLGNVDEAVLPSIYKGALCLAFPSLYEGFGLPVVEAFACGTPVVTSNTTSLPEVAGDAALLVDPLSVDDLASALFRVCTDDALRRELTTRGCARAASFAWPQVAARVQAVLAQV